MLRIFYISILFLFLSTATISGQSLAEQNEAIYESLDYSAIPFGLLIDKGSTTLDLLNFDGDLAKDSIVVNKKAGELLYNSVQTANTTDRLPLPLLVDLNRDLDILAFFHQIPFVMVFQKMSRIKANAIPDQLLVLNNDQLDEGPNTSESPYEATQLFFQYPAVTEFYSFTPRFKLTAELSADLFHNPSNTPNNSSTSSSVL